MKSYRRWLESRLVVAGGVLVLSVTLKAAPDGKAIYQQKCSMCHGMEGKGYAAIKTPDLTDPKVQAAMSDAQMTDIIKNGKKGTAMVGWDSKLSPDEIKAVGVYIRSLAPKK